MNIKEIRKCLNMTQKEFSAFTQIPLRTLQGWEYKERKAPVYVIKLLEENLQLKGIIKDTIMRKITVEEEMLIEDYFRTERLIKEYEEAILVLENGGNMFGIDRNITEEERNRFIVMQKKNMKRARERKKEILEKVDINLIETMRGDYE